MITYYELLEDGTIGLSTPFEDVAQSLNLKLSTEKEIIYAWDGKKYFKGEEPPKPSDLINDEQKYKRQEAFVNEADPLKYNYEEAVARYGYSSVEAVEAKTIWLEKKDEIRERYPYIDTES